MEYSIHNPTLYFSDRKLWSLADEINSLELKKLKAIVEDFQRVFEGAYDTSSFGKEMTLVTFTRSKAKVEYYNKLVSILPSKDLFEAIKLLYESRNALVHLLSS